MGSDLFVVGIGASAGGLPAMIELLEHASCHKNMCFVIVSHVPRYTENDLAQILSRASKLEASEVHDGVGVEHCKLYTIPPNQYVRIARGQLWLTPRHEGESNQSADVFFASLASEHLYNAIGIVLSGAKVGADGAKGVEAIKEVGGHTYAQDPTTAKFPAMPELAIATGCVDSVLSPARIGLELSLVSWA